MIDLCKYTADVRCFSSWCCLSGNRRSWRELDRASTRKTGECSKCIVDAAVGLVGNADDVAGDGQAAPAKVSCEVESDA